MCALDSDHQICYFSSVTWISLSYQKQTKNPNKKCLTCSAFFSGFLSACKNWQFSLASFWTSSIRPMSSLPWSLHKTPALRVGERAKRYLNPQSQDMTLPQISTLKEMHLFSHICGSLVPLAEHKQITASWETTGDELRQIWISKCIYFGGTKAGLTKSTVPLSVTIRYPVFYLFLSACFLLHKRKRARG